jgi:hypothetical protein
MNENTKEAALAAGAKTEMDFSFFSQLVAFREQTRNPPMTIRSERCEQTRKRDFLLHDYYLKNGRFYEPQPLPKGYHRGSSETCYCNALNLARGREDLTYCEGIACRANGQDMEEHGWCVTAEGKVIEVTWTEVGLSYFGVTYTEDVIIKAKKLPVSEAMVIERRKR